MPGAQRGGIPGVSSGRSEARFHAAMMNSDGHDVNQSILTWPIRGVPGEFPINERVTTTLLVKSNQEVAILLSNRQLGTRIPRSATGGSHLRGGTCRLRLASRTRPGWADRRGFQIFKLYCHRRHEDYDSIKGRPMILLRSSRRNPHCELHPDLRLAGSARKAFEIVLARGFACGLPARRDHFD
jgi:hypothetical protein